MKINNNKSLELYTEVDVHKMSEGSNLIKKGLALIIKEIDASITREKVIGLREETRLNVKGDKDE